MKKRYRFKYWWISKCSSTRKRIESSAQTIQFLSSIAASIATVFAAIFAISTLNEMKVERDAAYKPCLVIEDVEDYYHGDIQEILSEIELPLKIRNVGVGTARGIHAYFTVSDFEEWTVKMTELLNAYAYAEERYEYQLDIRSLGRQSSVDCAARIRKFKNDYKEDDSYIFVLGQGEMREDTEEKIGEIGTIGYVLTNEDYTLSMMSGNFIKPINWLLSQLKTLGLNSIKREEVIPPLKIYVSYSDIQGIEYTDIFEIKIGYERGSYNSYREGHFRLKFIPQ